MSNNLFVVCGYPGVGKSTVSKIMEDYGMERYQTDKIRKELFGQNPTYSTEESQKTYSEMSLRAERSLKNGSDVVVEGTFSDRQKREKIENTATNNSSICTFVFVKCNSSIVRDRIENRSGFSDADFTIHQRIRDGFDEFQRDYKEIDNSGSKKELKRQVARLICGVEIIPNK